MEHDRCIMADPYAINPVTGRQYLQDARRGRLTLCRTKAHAKTKTRTKTQIQPRSNKRAAVSSLSIYDPDVSVSWDHQSVYVPVYIDTPRSKSTARPAAAPVPVFQPQTQPKTKPTKSRLMSTVPRSASFTSAASTSTASESKTPRTKAKPMPVMSILKPKSQPKPKPSPKLELKSKSQSRSRSKPAVVPLKASAMARTRTQTMAKSKTKSKTKTTAKTQSKSKARILSPRWNKMAAAIQQRVAPVLRRAETHAMRLEFARIMRGYLRDVSSCIQVRQGRMELVDNKTGEPVVVFDKRIGANSAYGVAYLNSGRTGLAKHLRFSAKLMASENENHQREVRLLRRMSALVETGVCPNMPLIYRIVRCDDRCLSSSACPKVAAQNKYFGVLNELANSDLAAWVQHPGHTQEACASVVMQAVLAIYAFHKQLRHAHNDCHVHNFLVHTVKPGGYWKYRLCGHDVLVPNLGHLLVLWDPGLASDCTGSYGPFLARKDYDMILSSLVLEPQLRDMVAPLRPTFQSPTEGDLFHLSWKEADEVGGLLQLIKSGQARLPGVAVDPVNVGQVQVLNAQPYNLDRAM